MCRNHTRGNLIKNREDEETEQIKTRHKGKQNAHMDMDIHTPTDTPTLRDA